MGRTILTDEEYARCVTEVMTYLDEHPFVNNAILRQTCGIDSDQGIWFFKRAMTDGLLVREGKAQATRYSRP